MERELAQLLVKLFKSHGALMELARSAGQDVSEAEAAMADSPAIIAKLTHAFSLKS